MGEKPQTGSQSGSGRDKYHIGLGMGFRMDANADWIWARIRNGEKRRLESRMRKNPDWIRAGIWNEERRLNCGQIQEWAWFSHL